MTDDSKKRRFPRLPKPGRKTAIAAAVLAGLGLLGLASLSYATYSYSKSYDGRILPGATIGGVDVSGKTERQAVRAVRKAMKEELAEEFSISWEDEEWTASLKDLGARLDVKHGVRAALAASSETSFMHKARMRVFGEELDFAHDLAIRFPRTRLRAFLAGATSDFDRQARDAKLDYSTGWIEIVEAHEGREVKLTKSVAALAEALEAGERTSTLVVDTVEPEVTEKAFKQVLLVHIGDNKLYLYQKGKITHEWTVATGMPDYMTPTGEFTIELKRYMPTWVNPHPDEGWGKDMPVSIPPGPGNPLGLRALNWTAPNIRFHGTPAEYSLGYNASHGCVRMSNDDVIELYDLVEVGTPIVSIVHGDLRPLYSSSSSDEPSAENTAE